MEKKKKKFIVYKIEAKLYFELEDDIIINEYLDKLREVGEAKVVDVFLEEKENM